MFKTLTTWRDESQQQFSKIVDSYHTSIIRGIYDLLEEVSDLKAQLAVTTNERNTLKETVNNLNNETRELNDKSSGVQPYAGGEENDKLDMLPAGNPEIISQLTIKDSLRISSDSEDEYIDLGENMGYIPIDAMDQEQSYQSNSKSDLNDSTHNEYDIADKDIINTEHEAEDEDKVDGSDEEQEESEGRRKVRGSLMYSSLDEQEISTVSSKMPSVDLKCPECTFAFSTREDLLVHSLNIHSKLPHSELNLTKPTPLKKSGRVRFKNNEVSAQRYGGKKLKCEQCNVLIHKNHINQHVKQVHDQIKDHACKECGYASSRKESLKRHWDAVHNMGSKKFKCEICPYSFAEKAKLKYHMISVHNMEGKKFKCKECPYSSARKCTLREHTEQVHEKKRSHFCGECGYAAYKSDTLKKHIESRHKINDRC